MTSVLGDERRGRPWVFAVTGVVVSLCAAIAGVLLGVGAWLAQGGDAGRDLPAAWLWDLAWVALVLVAVLAPVVGLVTAVVVRRRG